ncbi:MAG: hypothetical protein ACD_37C00635G0001, partial [uncultured bacterium]
FCAWNPTSRKATRGRREVNTMKGAINEEPTSKVVVLIDHTGARHSGERYDAMQALRDAETARPIKRGLAEITALSQSEDEVLWPDWNRKMRGREWG